MCADADDLLFSTSLSCYLLVGSLEPLNGSANALAMLKLPAAYAYMFVCLLRLMRVPACAAVLYPGESAVLGQARADAPPSAVHRPRASVWRLVAPTCWCFATVDDAGAAMYVIDACTLTRCTVYL